MGDQWWAPALNAVAAQLSSGVRAEMKRRIQHTNIQKERLALNEDTARMKAFFERELARFQRRAARHAAVRTEADGLRREAAARTAELAAVRQQLDETTAIVRRQMRLFEHIQRTWQPKETPAPPPPSPIGGAAKIKTGTCAPLTCAAGR